MSETEKTAVAKAPKVKLAGAALLAKRALRKGLKAKGRSKRREKILTNADFAKALFEGRSKRSAEKKTAFRKKKTRKK